VAILTGTVNPNGLATEAWFEYGTNPNLASFDNTVTQTIAAGSITQPVTQSLPGLTPGTTYHFRLVASNAGGFAEGKIFSFTTRNPPPAVTTGDPTSITLNGATLNGSVNPNGAATVAWFEYGPAPNLASITVTDNQNLGSGRDPVAMDTTLSALESGSTYYYRLVASSVEGEVEGEIRSFSTAFPAPAATTGDATNITTTGATFHGTVNPNGLSTEAWFEYGTDNTLATFIPTTPQPQGAGTADMPVSATPIAPLNPWSTYYFRTVARSIADPSIFTKGAIRSFPTGEYYVAFGDSITRGSGDDIPSDDVSLDGRNSGGGFEPILNNLRTAAKGYPHTVINAGVSGETSANGVSRIGGILSGNPSANYFLILYGTNDSLIPIVSKDAYKANMQAIITAIKNAGRIPYLAKVPYVDPTNPLFPPGFIFNDGAIRQYNQAIDELVADPLNGISVVPPDFYGWFQSHTSQLGDGLHPNGTGYRSMADLWFNALP
jgi:lysophospholipase L1-like esterase